MTICLRTVCGCERLIDISDRWLPHIYRVPYVRTNGALFTADVEKDRAASAGAGFGVRDFEQTGRAGTYGYPLYVEKVA
jgi:hypothetical protein